MSIKSDSVKLTLLVLINFVIRNNCDVDISENVDEGIKSVDHVTRDETRFDYDEYPNVDRDYEKKLTDTEESKESKDNESVSKEYNERVTTDNTPTTLTEESHGDVEVREEYDAVDGENREEHNDQLRTTYQDVTETATSYSPVSDSNVYRETLLEDFNNLKGFNSQVETTSQATTRSMESVEDTSPVDEDYENSGARNPKTESDKQPVDKRLYEKTRPVPALSKSSTLKSWLEDSWLRPPAGILVPLRPLALNRALGVWNDLAAEGLNVTDIVIVGYDSNGVNWRSRHNLQPTNSNSGERTVSEALSKLLLKYQDVYTDGNNDGTMRALASAAKLVPYDSALFVVTDKGAGDSQRLPLALRALVEKRLKVYTIWTDPTHPSADSELALQDLRNISSHTEGEVLPYSLQIMSEESSSNLASETDLQEWEPMTAPGSRRAKFINQPAIDTFDMLLVRRGSEEAITWGIPVENGVMVLRILIEGDVDHAVLYPPSDAPQIDIHNQTSIQLFSSTSKTVSQNPRDVFLVFPGSTLDFDGLSVLPAKSSSADVSALVGMWHLSVRCVTCNYRLSISARTDLHFYVEIEPRDLLKLRVMGPVASVRESALIDEYGLELAKLPFSYQPAADSDHDKDPMSDILADIPMPSVTSTETYVKILGRDIYGEPFVRVAGPLNHHAEVRMGRSASIKFPESINDLEEAEEINSSIYNGKLQYNDSNLLPFGQATTQAVNQRGSVLTSVQIGLSTRIYGAPRDRLQLYYEVTNFREQSVRFNFEAVGELRFLTGLEPRSQTIASGQTATIIVSLTINQNAQPGARDLITFTAFGLDQVSISTYVYVTNPGETIRDVGAPEMRHNFQGSCLGRQGSDCSEHVWSATIIARDLVGGLLRLTSSPLGLVYDSNFISGARDEVMASYRATCCAPRVIVNAVDAFGNANSYTIDISNYINEAGIAAIALGVILIIVLLVLIIFLTYWCVKRRKESRELPTYTTSRNIN
ncbi:uncharacterized protein LOC113404300 [Vanessa tameamea]|uniref:Uncharacterized protein LOC113404300 n=1 Tax=Vanessa tameamea TaxID=334116 RepID=A0ABM4AXZ7_VANTA